MSDALWPLALVVVGALATWTAQQWMALQAGPAAEIERLRYEVTQAVSRAETAAGGLRAKTNEVTALAQRVDGLERQASELRDLVNRLDNRTAKPVPRWAGV